MFRGESQFKKWREPRLKGVGGEKFATPFWRSFKHNVIMPSNNKLQIHEVPLPGILADILVELTMRSFFSGSETETSSKRSEKRGGRARSSFLLPCFIFSEEPKRSCKPTGFRDKKTWNNTVKPNSIKKIVTKYRNVTSPVSHELHDYILIGK